MEALFDRDFARKLLSLKESLLPYLKGKVFLDESPTGNELSPEPDSPRPYAPGDDIRSVDWNLYARLDRLYLKSMVREEEVPVILLLDTSASMAEPHPEKSRLALRVAAALADIYLSLGHRLLIIPWSDGLSGFHGPYSGETDLEKVLGLLSGLACAGGSDLKRSLAEVMPLTAGGRWVPVVISDFLFPLDYEREFGHIAVQVHPPRGIQILHQRETNFRLRGNLVLIDPETSAAAELHATYLTLRNYHEAFKIHLRGIEELFLRSGKIFLRVPAQQPFEGVVKRFFSLDTAADS